MVMLSHDAQGMLERYLRQVRASLRGHTSVDVDDVERDVQGHIEAALAGQVEPIDTRSLQRVLDELGSPEKWAPEDDDLPSWRRTLTRMRSGPEDWRLPYLTFGCFLAGLTMFLAPGNLIGSHGPLLWPLPLILMIASFALARASMSVLAAEGASIETRRWLIYPPLLAWYLPIALGLIGWPVLFVLGGNDTNPAFRDWTTRLTPTWYEVNVGLEVALALGAWWVLAGALLLFARRPLREVFWPFAEWIERRHAVRVALAGIATGAISLAIITFLNRM